MTRPFTKILFLFVLLFSCFQLRAQNEKYDRVAMLIDGPWVGFLRAPEELAAGFFFVEHFNPESLLTPENISTQLCEATNWGTELFDVIWIHIDRDGISSGHLGGLDHLDQNKFYDPNFWNKDRFEQENGSLYVNADGKPMPVFYNDDVKNRLKHFVNAGGNLYLSKHATMMLGTDFLGRIENQFAPNVFGAGDRGSNPNKNIFAINPQVNKDHNDYKVDFSSHAIFNSLEKKSNKEANIVPEEDYIVIPLSNATRPWDHNCMWNFDNPDLKKSLDDKLTQLSINNPGSDLCDYLQKFEFINDCKVMASWGQNYQGETAAYVIFHSWTGKYFTEPANDGNQEVAEEAGPESATYNNDIMPMDAGAITAVQVPEYGLDENGKVKENGMIIANGNGGGDFTTAENDSDDYSRNIRQLHLNSLSFLYNPEKTGKGDDLIITSIQDVAIDKEEDIVSQKAEFFDLNGRKVNLRNLGPGIYIKRQGSKTSKLIIR